MQIFKEFFTFGFLVVIFLVYFIIGVEFWDDRAGGSEFLVVKFAVFGEVAIWELRHEAEFDDEVTGVVLVVVFFTVRVEFFGDEVVDGFDVFAHDGEVEHVVAFSGDMIDISVAIINQIIWKLKLV